MSDETEKEDIFTKYHAEFVEDTKLDEFNIKDRAMTAIAIKHKWVGRLMRHKRDLKKLENAKKQAVAAYAKKIASSDVGIAGKAAKTAAESSDLVSRITTEIENVELLVEYLEKAERILNSMTYDIKNVIEVQKMETL